MNTRDIELARQMLNDGDPIDEVAKRFRVKPNTLHKALAGCADGESYARRLARSQKNGYGRS